MSTSTTDITKARHTGRAAIADKTVLVTGATKEFERQNAALVAPETVAA